MNKFKEILNYKLGSERRLRPTDEDRQECDA